MSTTTSARRAVCGAIAAQLAARADLANVQVLDGPDLNDPQAEQILVGAEIRGTESGVRTLRAGRKARLDQFEISILFRTLLPQTTPAGAAERVEQLYGALDDLLAADPTLGSVPGLQHAQVTSWDGPDVIPTPEGHVGFIEARVACLTHLE